MGPLTARRSVPLPAQPGILTRPLPLRGQGQSLPGPPRCLGLLEDCRRGTVNQDKRTIDNATLHCYRSLMELAMTPSIVKNVVRMPKQRSKRVRTRISYMSSEQLERFLRAAKEFGPREHAMFLFAVAHGARAQEICNLRLSDINFGNEQVHIARLKGSLPSTQTLLKVKGNSLFDEKAVLKAWLAIRQPDADTFVFNSQKSTQMNRVTVFKLFRAIARKAGLGETLQHPHVLKHTAAMLLVQQGANAYLIRQALGHKSFDSTLAYVNPSDADASAALAKAFNQAL